MVLNFKQFSLNENLVFEVNDLMKKLMMNDLKLSDVREMLIGKKINVYEGEISKNIIFLHEKIITNVEIRKGNQLFQYAFGRNIADDNLILHFKEGEHYTNVTIYPNDIILILEPEEIKEEDIEWF
jgi:hypothetical protein